jgi:dolichol-phosphate mannosyltransferase
VLALHLPFAEKEIIVVDDGSSDATPALLKNYAKAVQILTHTKNKGKGAAVRTGFVHATGDYAVVQDADLEYDPNDLTRMLAFAVEKNLKAVYGSRRLSLPGESVHHGAWQYYLGGLIITCSTNLLYGANLTDEPTCYKMVHRTLLPRLELQSDGFEFCPEITAKIIRLEVPIHEIPIHYDPRSEAEGKKIRPKDGIVALLILLKYRFWRPS